MGGTVASGEVTQHSPELPSDLQEHSVSVGVPISNLADLRFLTWAMGRSAFCKATKDNRGTWVSGPQLLPVAG